MIDIVFVSFIDGKFKIKVILVRMVCGVMVCFLVEY